MKRIIFTISALAVASYVGICILLFVVQRSLVYFPQPRAVSDPESTMRLMVDGAELVVSLRPRAGSKALIYFGGNAEDVSGSLTAFGEWFPDHALYLLHYRGYGGSTGAPTERDNHSDAAALFKQVQGEHPDVVVIGRSLGTGVAVRLASQLPVSRLILVTPYDSLEKVAAAAYPYVPVRWLLRDKYHSGAYASRVRIRTTILVAEHDEIIPRASSETLLGRFAPGVASLVVIPGTGHNTIGTTSEYRSALRAAL